MRTQIALLHPLPSINTRHFFPSPRFKPASLLAQPSLSLKFAPTNSKPPTMALQCFLGLTHLISNSSDATNPGEQTIIGGHHPKQSLNGYFKMPLHYPRYTKADYEKMEEWKLDVLLKQYGLDSCVNGHSLQEKRNYAIGTFLWPDQL